MNLRILVTRMSQRFCNILVHVSLWCVSIGLVGRVFTNGPENQGSILGQVIPKTQKMVLDATSLNSQHHKVCIKGKVEQSRDRS